MGKKFALIVAGGSGKRMKNALPKQFMEVNGLPVLMHTINCFIKYDPEMKIILVLPEDQLKTWDELCNKYRFDHQVKVATGGAERFYSVRNGLDLVDDEDGIVFIHDGVRPLVSQETIHNCYQKALKEGNSIPVVSVSESVRMVEDTRNKAVDRSRYFLVQTPQTFSVKQIKTAYQQNFSPEFTDDASVAEKDGNTIRLVEGNRENIKITWPADLQVASVYIGNLNSNQG